MRATECVTVIMNTFNERRDWLAASIERIAPQVKQLLISACEGDWNLTYMQEILPKNARIVLLPHSQQLGKCPQQSFRQINNALPYVATEYVSWTSSDDLMHPHKYQTELDLLIRTNKQVCYSDYEMVSEHGRHLSFVKLGNYSYERHLVGNFVSDLSLMRTDLLKEFGLLGDKWRNYAYWDMWLRIYETHGDVFVNNPKSMWQYKQDVNSTHIKRKHSAEMQEEARRDREAMLNSHRQHE